MEKNLKTSTLLKNDELSERAIIEKHNRILSSISHDLKSPMVAIIGFSEIILREMLEENGSNAKWIQMLQRVTSAGRDMFKLIENILEMAKMEAGKEGVEPEWIMDPEKELREVLKTFEYEAKAKGIGLSLDMQSPLPTVRWDFTRLRYHVLNNLISNSLKFTPPGGRITLSVQAGNKIVVIKVKDTGLGIPDSERERIFLRFEQIHLTSHRAFKGSGLGLYNAHLFVKQHGGKIYLDSSVSEGATFIIELPVDALKWNTDDTDKTDLRG